MSPPKSVLVTILAIAAAAFIITSAANPEGASARSASGTPRAASIAPPVAK